MADEVTSQNEQILSICVRFVDKNKNSRDEFLEFLPTKPNQTRAVHTIPVI